jgi:hypothetical protein
VGWDWVVGGVKIVRGNRFCSFLDANANANANANINARKITLRYGVSRGRCSKGTKSTNYQPLYLRRATKLAWVT